jgi:hypothetical protein
MAKPTNALSLIFVQLSGAGHFGLYFSQPKASSYHLSLICYLWGNSELCKKMGQAGREKAMREYSSQKYYQHLMSIYKRAIIIEKE